MDDATLELLELFSKRHSLTLIELAAILNVDCFSVSDPVHFMMERNYIRTRNYTQNWGKDVISLDTELEITYIGRVAIQQAKKDRRCFKFTEFRSWVTLSIALVALILSIINVFTNR